METASTVFSPNMPTSETRGTLIKLAWLAIVLGIAVEMILIAVHSFFKAVPGVNALFADLVGKMSWSVIVCVGLGLLSEDLEPSREDDHGPREPEGAAGIVERFVDLRGELR